MSLFRRAVLSTIRRPGKSILLFLILFILGNMIAGAIAVRQATDNVERRIKQALGAIVTLGPDSQRLLQAMTERDPSKDKINHLTSPSGDASELHFHVESPFPPPPGVDEIVQIAQSSYVKNYDYTTMTTVGSADLLLNQSDQNYVSDIDHFGITLYGTQFAPVMAIAEGHARLIAGRTFHQAEIDRAGMVGLISKELADLNDIKVGDNLLLTHYVGLVATKECVVDQFDLTIQIIGIYQANQPESLSFGDLYGHSQNERRDTIRRLNSLIVPNGVVQSILEQDHQRLIRAGLPEGYEESWLRVHPADTVFALHQADDVANFIAENSSKIPEGTLFFSNHNIYPDIAAPLQQTQKMAELVLAISLGATIVIGGLTVLLFLRERHQELGILLSLGESKRRLTRQMMCEVLLIAVFALGLALFSGQLLANQLSDSMIRDELVADVNHANDEAFWAARRMMGPFSAYFSAEEVADQYEIRFSAGFVFWYGVICLATVWLSAGLPTLYIVNLKPKQILLN